MEAAWLAPGVPADYYESLATGEGSHWWHVGMRKITRSLLGSHVGRGGRVLDAGCGAGGFLRWLVDEGHFSDVAGVDVSAAALELSARRVPEAQLHCAPLSSLPFPGASFDLIATNDVLQHIPEDELERSAVELRRVLAPDGLLLVRTNGARTYRRERGDWCVFDRASLARLLTQAGFACDRVTYANMLGSAVAAATGHAPHAPSTSAHGVPTSVGRLRSVVGRRTLALEARYLARPSRSLPYGHTLFAVGRPA